MLSRLFSGIREQFGKNVSRQESSITKYSSMKNNVSSNNVRKNTADDFIRKDLISGTWN
ncbi:unnamed protein product [Cunninghamella echinulata]